MTAATSVRQTADFERVLQAINRGQDDDSCLSGRHYNERYWRSAKAALGRIALQLDRAASERDALKAVFDASE
jgi:hypothetical protein